MKNVVIVENPFAQNALYYLRDKTTNTKIFRMYSDYLVRILLSESISGIPLVKLPVQTPIATTIGKKRYEDIILLPILRAGLAMLPSALALFPSSQVGFAGLARDEKTAVAQEYYWKIPKTHKKSLILILDPMLATGGSILHVLQKLKEQEYYQIRVISAICAKPGIEAVHKEFPKVQIITAAVDQELNDQKFIVPGLGDYGDRYFGT